MKDFETWLVDEIALIGFSSNSILVYQLHQYFITKSFTISAIK